MTTRSKLFVSASSIMVFVLAGAGGYIRTEVVSAANALRTASVYNWQAGEGDWQSPSSWWPARTMPAANDILVFNIGGTTTATNVPTQTIGQLMVSGNTTVDLQSSASVALNIAGGDGDDLTIERDSALNFTGANAIAANLATGATASISGSMTFSSSGAAAHRLTAVDIGAITFDRPAVFTADMGFTGNPFGTSELNSVIFVGGSSYVCKAGGDPFGAAEPDTVAVFRTGSLFSLQGDVTPSLSGRTYANFEVNYPNGIFRVFGPSAFVIDDLRLVAGILDLYLPGDLKGDITISSGTHLDFLLGTIRLNGLATQTISGSGGQGAGGGATIVIDNPKGVVLGADRPLYAWDLQLVNGVVDVTDPTWWVGVAGTVTRSNGYVNGYMQRLFSASGSYAFDIGTDNGYSPVTIDATAGVFPTALTIRAVQGPQPNIFDPTLALSLYKYLMCFRGKRNSQISLFSFFRSFANQAKFVRGENF